MFNKRNDIPVKVLLILSMLFFLSGCATAKVPSEHESTATESEQSASQPVYGSPQIIYRIDKERYFTLEDYTSCENGKTFYNNKAKGIHTQISPSSGYLFKGRLFWLSTRDDYLAFPMTRNENKAACIGSDKGCLNIISVTTDGGKKMRSVTYGSNTQDPNGDTKDYDMLVTNDGFYMIEFPDGERVAEDGYVLKWTFSPASKLANPAYPGVTGPEYQKGLPMDDISKVKQTHTQCDRKLEPDQQSGNVAK
ncbi:MULTISPECIES: hypothetical protein [unclassified Enterobacter]|jgi:hypothetical protein|uniref:T6SS immunity protein Tli3 family protein n=1 Tax=unclassified Enterobacter TaxID=2608935 RepID=UPI00292B2122|nr:hypothetical protein [Enterobacter sp. 23-M-SZ-13]MDV0597997.1 hypothetical protein [Enterobacter sp. 23-M-SZ-13]